MGRKWKRLGTASRKKVFRIESWIDGQWRIIGWERGRSRADAEVLRRRREGFSARARKDK